MTPSHSRAAGTRKQQDIGAVARSPGTGDDALASPRDSAARVVRAMKYFNDLRTCPERQATRRLDTPCRSAGHRCRASSCYSSALGSIGMQIDSIGSECGFVGENAT